MALHGLKAVEFCRIPRSEAAGEFSSALLQELKKGVSRRFASPSEFCEIAA